MIQNKQNEALIKVSKWISPRIDKYETILVLIFLGVLILKVSGVFLSGILLTLILSTMAVLYYFMAFAVLEDEQAGGIENFIHKLIYFASSVGMIGILSKLQRWPNSNLMIMCGSITLAISLLIIMFVKSKKPELKIFPPRTMLRILFIAAVGLLLNFTPKENLIKLNLMKEMKMPATEDTVKHFHK